MADYCPTSENICVKRADTPIIRVAITDPDDSSVVDITGYTFVLTVDPSPVPANADNNVFQVSVGPIGDGSTGIVSIQPSSANTDQTPGVYFYDIEMLTTAPSRRTIFEGEFEIQQDISKTD
jgi:hypothetical protein